ncbi:rhamnogalacturonan acetylesterase [Cellulosimicrobium terreum]|nr:rhamnogalacturonan acetylesterase [Cellulosimicrobium terreum]
MGSTEKRAIHIAGDSTAAPKGRAAAPETGWGMALPYYVPAVPVVNHARNGRSSRSFVERGGLAAVMETLGPDDVLVVQFGHNDAKVSAPERFTEPWTSYQEHLRLYVEAARRAGARPVLLTPVERRAFDPQGRAVPSHGEYPDAMRALAEQEGVPLVDVQQSSLALWDQLGSERTREYFLHTADGRRDDTHFGVAGASAVAQLVASGLVGAGLLVADDVVRLGCAVPESALERAVVDPNA